MMRAARHNPSVLLLVLMAIWVLVPFAALLWAIRVSQRWQEFARRTLYMLTLVVAGGAFIVYLKAAIHPPRVRAAAPFVAVPLASWILSIVVFAAVRLTRKHFK